MSTGMCDLQDINEAVAVLEENGTPEIVLLHCNTQYPTPFEHVNLNAMQTIREATEKEIGYSDHTQGIEVPVVAVALGATVIEKHFTLDKEELCKRVLALPMHPYLTEKVQDEVIGAVKVFVGAK